MTIKIPETTFFGEPVKGSIERALKRQESVPEPETVAVSGNINPSEYLRIPGTNTIISKFELPDYNNLNWKETHFKLQENGLFMPTPNLFMPHFMNVVDAYKNKKPLFDAVGNPISENELENIYLHLTLQDSQKRAWAWLDAKFKGNLREGTMKIHTNHRVVNNKLKPQTIQDLEQCIKDSDGYVELKFNSQGLPTRKSGNQKYVQGENLSFLYPKNGKVAKFISGPVRTIFYCERPLNDRSSSLSVFACASNTSQKDSKDFIYVPSIGAYVAKEKTLHNLDWNKTHKELIKKGSRMPTIPEFIGFVNHLKQKPTPEYNKILDEILTARSPWKGEYLDARFKEIKGEMHIHYAGKIEKLDPFTLMEGKGRGINIDYWLKSHTNQGFPLINTPTGNFYYFHPENGGIACLGPNSSGVAFDCGERSNYFGPNLGVREVRNSVP